MTGLEWMFNDFLLSFQQCSKEFFNTRVTWSLSLCLQFAKPFHLFTILTGCDCQEILNSLNTFSLSRKEHSMKVMWQIKWLTWVMISWHWLSSERKWMSRKVLIIILQEESHVKQSWVWEKTVLTFVNRKLDTEYWYYRVVFTIHSTLKDSIADQEDGWECQR